MIRILIILAVLAALAAGLSWLADRPGEIVLTWQGYEIATSLMAAAFGVLILVALLLFTWTLLRLLWRTPGAVGGFFRTRKRSRGFQAVTQGMIAVGSGDVARAKKTATEAQRILGDEPLALLLRAQSAQLSGDRAAAETAFRAMLASPETKPLGLRGLFVEARRRGDAGAARKLAAEAVETSPGLPWAGTALLEFQSIEKDWNGALQTLQRNMDARLIDKETGRRHRAVLLAARALEEAETDRAKAKASALDALKLAPGLVPAAVLAAKLFTQSGDPRKATKILEAAWRAGPHPEVGAAYVEVRPGDSARDKLSRAQTLAAQAPGTVESAVVLARAALAARDFQMARGALEPHLKGGTERLCLLMADIEEAEHGATGKVREWLARAVRAPRDAVWTADGLVSPIWMPVSPATGRIDAFEWKNPVERLGPPLAEAADDVIADIDEPPQLAVVPSPPPEAAPEPAKFVEILPPVPIKPEPVAAAEPVIATHPTPDDPGPEETAGPKRFKLFG